MPRHRAKPHGAVGEAADSRARRGCRCSGPEAPINAGESHPPPGARPRGRQAPPPPPGCASPQPGPACQRALPVGGSPRRAPPTTQAHPIIVENLIGIKRRIGVYQKAKKPLLFNDIKQIIKQIDQSSGNSSKKQRDKALILVGFAGGFRRSELVSITKEDVEFVKEGVKIFVKKSKSDQSGEGMTKAIPSFKYNDYCPVENLRLWMFENRNDRIFPISDKNVALIIKKYALQAGFDEKKYAGHSLRSGFATTTAETGASKRKIMAMTGHKTTQMVRRYIHEANLFKNNALNKIKI